MSSLLSLLRFAFVKYISGYQISDLPFFEDEGLRFFQEQIRTSRVYLEYGTGGSSVLAASHVELIVGVDTDPHFLKAVKKKLRHNEATAVSDLLHCNIGLTGPFGRPYFKDPTPGRLARWARYPALPWQSPTLQGRQPDTVLIDGRFRVAACLYSLLQISKPEATTILFDDYMDRPWYWGVEKFAERLETRGRMVVLRKKPDFDAAACQAALQESLTDWR